MNEVSIIINGVRYDAVERVTQENLCYDCDLYRNCKLDDCCGDLIGFKIFKKSTKSFITKEILLENGFEAKQEPMVSLADTHFIGERFFKRVQKKGNKEYFFTIDLDNNYSNSIDRDWNLHIDNNDMQSVCGCDIQTTEHFNTLMELMEIDFKL